MENLQKYKKQIFIGIISLLFMIGGLFIGNKRQKELSLREIPYSSSFIEDSIETKDYIIRKNQKEPGITIEVSEKNNDRIFFDIDRDAFRETRTSYGISNYKADAANNILYYMKTFGRNYQINAISLDTFEEKNLYTSQDYFRVIELFGVNLWGNVSSLLAMNENDILDFLVMEDCLVLIKTGYVSVYNGIQEKRIIDFRVGDISNYGNIIYFTNVVGNLFYLDLNDYKIHKIENVIAAEVMGMENGVQFINLMDNNKECFYDISVE